MSPDVLGGVAGASVAAVDEVEVSDLVSSAVISRHSHPARATTAANRQRSIRIGRRRLHNVTLSFHMSSFVLMQHLAQKLARALAPGITEDLFGRCVFLDKTVIQENDPVSHL